MIIPDWVIINLYLRPGPLGDRSKNPNPAMTLGLDTLAAGPASLMESFSSLDRQV